MSHQGQPPHEASPPGGFVTVPRSMRLGPLAAGVGVGAVIVAAVATALFGPPGAPAAPAATATVAASPSPSPVPGSASASPRPGAAPSSGLVTLVPNSPVSTPSATPPQAPTSTGPSTPSASSPAAAFPDVQGFQECARSGSGPFAAVGTANESTSCGFAVNVWKAYLAAGIAGGSGTVTASSPATGKTYEVACSGAQPARCSGGINGRVLIYGGSLV